MSQEHDEGASGYFADPIRERRIRTPELGLWIACLSNAKTQAAQLAAGIPHEKPSGDLRRLRWQLTWDVADLWEWLRADDEYSFAWIISVLESSLGRGCYDEPMFVREVAACLTKAEAHIEVLAQQIARSAMLRGNKANIPDAGECAQALRCTDVSRQVQGPKRVLRQAPGPGAEALGDGWTKKQEARVERKRVAENVQAHPRARRVSVPVPRLHEVR